MTRSAVALIRLATPPAAQTPDAELLRSFVASQADEDAFAELVRRHGPMVLAVCRRVLSDTHDAEDAFQAVFLVLARKASAIRGTNLAGWLYGVAVRTARGVRIMRDRRRKREQAASASGGRKPPVFDSPTDYDTARIIDEELAKLPEHYRDAIIVCELRGLTRKDGARELGIPEGTLSSRLAAAKRKLAALLAARGITGAVALAAVLAPAAVSAALEQSTTFAIRGTAATTANAAASTILKGMLFDQLKGAVLATGLLLTAVCGGLAMSGSPDSSPTTNPPANTRKPADEPVAALVKQLGSEDFAEREAASKELRALGPKAETALHAGLKSESPEVRARCERVLAEVRKDALDALAKNFDPKAENVPDHPIWKRFKAIAGDTPASRELFARIIKNTEWLRRLDAAETGPDAAQRHYREAVVSVSRKKDAKREATFRIYLWPCDVADQAVYLLLLGSYPGSESVEHDGDYVFGEDQLVTARGLPLGLQGKEIAPGLKDRYEETAVLTPGSDRVFAKLLAAYLSRRTESNTISRGCRLAVKYRAPEVLPTARAIAADQSLPKMTRGCSLGVVAQFGTPADLPLFEALFDDPAIIVAGEPMPDASPPTRFESQVRDDAIAMALLLCDQDPFEFGFDDVERLFRRENGRPVIANYENAHLGFGTEKARAAAHAKVKAFLDKKKEGQKDEPPVTGAKVWPHFAKVVGDDKDSRALFDLIVSNPKNLELLEKAATGSPDLLKLYRARRDELNKLTEEAVKDFLMPPMGWNLPARPQGKPAAPPPSGVPVAETAGWLLLGTYLDAKGDDVDGPRPDFLHPWLGQPLFAESLGKGPIAKPLRKLVAAWLANRGDEPCATTVGLELAVIFDIPDALSPARRIIEKYAGAKNSRVKAVACGCGLLVVGKYGTKDDLLLVAKFADDTTEVSTVLLDKPGQTRPGTADPVDGLDATTQVRDLALTMAIHLHGGNPRDFGFFWRDDLYKLPFPNSYSFHEIGFLSKSSRDAAHKKAKEWLDKQKK